MLSAALGKINASFVLIGKSRGNISYLYDDLYAIHSIRHYRQ